jgi:CheY-like chemotaxis protein
MTSTKPTEAPARGEIVLLVEDDEAVRQVAVLILDLLGYEVVEFAEATAARDYLAGDGPVSVLFSDIRLPGSMIGTDLALEARRLRPDLPILLTTGNAGDLTPHVLRRLPGVEVLLKPYGRARLQRMLAAAIARRPVR